MENVLKGIDISEFNGEIDFTKVKKEVDFVYIRATYGRFGTDKKFKEYTEAVIKNEIPFSFYYYSYAVDKDKALEEVKFFIDTIKEYKEKISFPVAIDMEDSDGYKLKNGNPTKEILTEICKLACDEITKESLMPVIYANADWFKNRLDEEELKPYMKWLAWWTDDETKIDKTKYIMWQNSSKGKINGIKSNVDLDISFVDFIKLKEYVINVQKINFIKSRTLLQDIAIQYFSCYKWGKELIEKIYNGLKDKDKILKKELTIEEKKKEIKKFFNLEQKTIDYISVFIYADDTFTILYNAITENLVEVQDDEE